MIDDLKILEAKDRQYVLDRTAEVLAATYAKDLDLLTPEQVAVLLKCGTRTIARKLPQVRLGPREIRYRRADVEAFIAANSTPPKG